MDSCSVLALPFIKPTMKTKQTLRLICVFAGHKAKKWGLSCMFFVKLCNFHYIVFLLNAEAVSFCLWRVILMMN